MRDETLAVICDSERCYHFEKAVLLGMMRRDGNCSCAVITRLTPQSQKVVSLNADILWRTKLNFPCLPGGRKLGEVSLAQGGLGENIATTGRTRLQSLCPFELIKLQLMDLLFCNSSDAAILEDQDRLTQGDCAC